MRVWLNRDLSGFVGSSELECGTFFIMRAALPSGQFVKGHVLVMGRFYSFYKHTHPTLSFVQTSKRHCQSSRTHHSHSETHRVQSEGCDLGREGVARMWLGMDVACG